MCVPWRAEGRKSHSRTRQDNIRPQSTSNRVPLKYSAQRSNKTVFSLFPTRIAHPFQSLWKSEIKLRTCTKQGEQNDCHYKRNWRRVKFLNVKYVRSYMNKIWIYVQITKYLQLIRRKVTKSLANLCRLVIFYMSYDISFFLILWGNVILYSLPSKNTNCDICYLTFPLIFLGTIKYSPLPLLCNHSLDYGAENTIWSHCPCRRKRK